MKTLWLYGVKIYLKIGLFFYFRSIKVVGLEHIPKHKPTLLLANHQNALLDALLIATQLPQFSYFLTRASVFKDPIISKLLKSLNMLPVYRIRDGWSNLTNNNSIFRACSAILMNGETVVIFPEGNHNLARRVRPLSKGFTRIVYDVVHKDPKIELQLLPVGLNYRNAEHFVDEVSVYIGKPIKASSYCTEQKNEDIEKLRKDVHSRISKLTTHIPQTDYTKTLHKLEEHHVDFLDPISVNTCISNDYRNCKKTKRTSLQWLHSGLKVMLIFNLWFPYLIWKYFVQPKVVEIEFISTFRFTVAVTLVPMYLLIVAGLTSYFIGFETAIIYILFVFVLSLLTVKL